MCIEQKLRKGYEENIEYVDSHSEPMKSSQKAPQPLNLSPSQRGQATQYEPSR